MTGSPLEKKPSRLGVWRDALRFRLRPPAWDLILTPELPFGPEASRVFLERLSRSASYLEFGAGSSTLQAAHLAGDVTSVESDARFLGAVGLKCLPMEPHLIHGDIGRTGPWGVPSSKRPSRHRVAKWRNYPTAPWRVRGEDYRADLILVDGRFRVACALAVILHQPDENWTLLVDDYAGRTEYQPIGQFAELVALHGRMAEFRPIADPSRSEAESAFEHFVSDWR